jgi:hypothetical protein
MTPSSTWLEQEEGDGWQDLDNTWLEMEVEEDNNEDRAFYVNAFTGKEGLKEDEDVVYYADVIPRGESKLERKEEDGWWTLDPSWLESEEENEEETLDLNRILSEGCSKKGDNKDSTLPTLSLPKGEEKKEEDGIMPRGAVDKEGVNEEGSKKAKKRKAQEEDIAQR